MNITIKQTKKDRYESPEIQDIKPVSTVEVHGDSGDDDDEPDIEL